VFGEGHAFIRQREIPTHSQSFEQALTDALCENPDILLVSQLRTPEPMRLALEAANSALVFAAVHSASCAEALERICNAFPVDAQDGIRAQLAECLIAVVCQRLDYLDKQQLQVPRCEVLTASTATRSVIRAGQFGQIAGVIQKGADEGMWSFERYEQWMEQKQDWLPPPVPAQVREPLKCAPGAARALGRWRKAATAPSRSWSSWMRISICPR
jgi:twitching motility protein PilT